MPIPTELQVRNTVAQIAANGQGAIAEVLTELLDRVNRQAAYRRADHAKLMRLEEQYEARIQELQREVAGLHLIVDQCIEEAERQQAGLMDGVDPVAMRSEEGEWSPLGTLINVRA